MGELVFVGGVVSGVFSFDFDAFCFVLVLMCLVCRLFWVLMFCV